MMAPRTLLQTLRWSAAALVMGGSLWLFVEGGADQGDGEGNGVMEMHAFEKRVVEATLAGVDYDPDQVARARRNLAAHPALAGRIVFDRGDATALAFPKQTFDFAYELNVLHHIADYPRALLEVGWVLRPGAPFLLQDLSRAFFPSGVRRLFPPESLFTREELSRELEAAGFSVEAAAGRVVLFLRARRR
ncbi:MAG: class I SAM-dependent methyltransferase [Candidatus Rokuibacteriota bacterium]